MAIVIKNKILRRLWKIVKNKYVATLIIFLLYFCFADNNIFVAMRLRAELSELKKEQRTLRSEMQHDSTHMKVLQGDREAMERYGREVYYLRAEDEEVYVFDK